MEASSSVVLPQEMHRIGWDYVIFVYEIDVVLL